LSASEQRSGPDIPATATTINYNFAVATCEVTIEQFRRFNPEATFAEDVDGEKPRSPANKISFQQAIAYCRWLNVQEGLPEDEICYGEHETPSARLPAERERRSGYRLPTEEEWEFICRAGSTTPWFAGITDEQLARFGCYSANSGGRMRRVGWEWPNARGIFDMAGNMSEWVQSQDGENCVLRGGSYNASSRGNRSASRYHPSTDDGFSFTGFRIARTIPDGR
jgi:formylglycine-generating enzyme required for sulfatase activity